MSQATMETAQGQSDAVKEDTANKPIKSNTLSCNSAILFGNEFGSIIASGTSLALPIKLTARLYSFNRADMEP
ncbi:hypothetical protein ACHAQJ_004616 [Trichoderma viride]